MLAALVIDIRQNDHLVHAGGLHLLRQLIGPLSGPTAITGCRKAQTSQTIHVFFPFRFIHSGLSRQVRRLIQDRAYAF